MRKLDKILNTSTSKALAKAHRYDVEWFKKINNTAFDFDTADFIDNAQAKADIKALMWELVDTTLVHGGPHTPNEIQAALAEKINNL